MEFKSSQQRDITLHSLRQIKSAILDLQEWNKDLKKFISYSIWISKTYINI